jgi:hypothetical protein
MFDSQDSTFKRLNIVGNNIHIQYLIKYMALNIVF